MPSFIIIISFSFTCTFSNVLLPPPIHLPLFFSLPFSSPIFFPCHCCMHHTQGCRSHLAAWQRTPAASQKDEACKNISFKTTLVFRAYYCLGTVLFPQVVSLGPCTSFPYTTCPQYSPDIFNHNFSRHEKVGTQAVCGSALCYLMLSCHLSTKKISLRARGPSRRQPAPRVSLLAPRAAPDGDVIRPEAHRDCRGSTMGLARQTLPGLLAR